MLGCIVFNVMVVLISVLFLVIELVSICMLMMLVLRCLVVSLNDVWARMFFRIFA